MHEIAVDVAAEVVATALLAAGAGVLTVVGLLSEQAGMANLSTGHVALGGWYVYMGGLALYVGLYLLLYRELRPRVTQLLAS